MATAAWDPERGRNSKQIRGAAGAPAPMMQLMLLCWQRMRSIKVVPLNSMHSSNSAGAGAPQETQREKQKKQQQKKQQQKGR